MIGPTTQTIKWKTLPVLASVHFSSWDLVSLQPTVGNAQSRAGLTECSARVLRLPTIPLDVSQSADSILNVSTHMEILF